MRAAVPKQRALGKNNKFFVYVGCFTTPARQGKGDGVSAHRINPINGAWRSIQQVGGLVNPSWLLANHDGNVLYALHANEEYACSYLIDRATGRLTPLNRAATGVPRPVGWQPTGGQDPRLFVLDPAGRSLYAANLSSGTIKRFELDAKTGALTTTRQITKTSSPCAIAFVSAE